MVGVAEQGGCCGGSGGGCERKFGTEDSGWEKSHLVVVGDVVREREGEGGRALK